MNFIDRFRIKRNPNIIDSFNESKLTEDVIEYAIALGYQFNPSMTEKLISSQSYQKAFKNEKEVFEYMKQSVIGSDESTKRDFYNLYSLYNEKENIYNFCKTIKEDDELSEAFVYELEKWFSVLPHDSKCETVIQVIDGKDKLIDKLLEQHFDALKSNVDFDFRKFSKYLTSIRTPKELHEQNISDSRLSTEFINNANPENFIELFEQFDLEDFNENDSSIVNAILSHVDRFIPYLDRLDESCKVKRTTGLINKVIENRVLEYLKENNISYNKNIPKFTLWNDEYVLQSITQNPLSMQEISEVRKFHLKDYEREVEEIAKKISEEQIKFEGIIPECYLLKNIFESIVGVNPELLQQAENTRRLVGYTVGMTDKEAIEYYKKIGAPFNKNTVINSNILCVVECLKNDRDTLSDSYTEYTNEEYKTIYEQIKDDIIPEEVLKNKFLAQNPYFVSDLIKSDVDLSKFDFQEIKHYEEFYLELRVIAMQRGMTLPQPKNYNGVKFTEEGRVYIELDNLDSIKKGLEYLKENGIEQDLLIKFPQNKNKEFVISDNIDFFERLAEENININFKYDTGVNEISLKQVIDNEHFMQYVAEDIKSKNFSPLEQLIAVYDITKAFKPYKEDESVYNSSASRGLYEYLGNEYMVCAGYADLVSNLGHRLGAPYSKVSLEVENTVSKENTRSC